MIKYNLVTVERLILMDYIVLAFFVFKTWSQQRDNQKFHWLNNSMDHLQKSDVNWVIPAMKHMREIFSLYPEGQANHKNSTAVFRPVIIGKMQHERQLIVIVCNSLNLYMERIRNYIKGKLFVTKNTVL